MIFYFSEFSEPRGHIGTPCLPEGVCHDSNAICRSDVCECGEGYYQKNNICSKCNHRTGTVKQISPKIIVVKCLKLYNILLVYIKF